MLISFVLFILSSRTGSPGVVRLQCFDRLGIDIPDKREWRLGTQSSVFCSAGWVTCIGISGAFQSNIIILSSILLSVYCSVRIVRFPLFSSTRVIDKTALHCFLCRKEGNAQVVDKYPATFAWRGGREEALNKAISFGDFRRVRYRDLSLSLDFRFKVPMKLSSAW